MKIEWTKEQLMKANDKLMKRNRRYKKALEFYAEKDHYQDNVIAEWGPMTEVLRDEGNIARQALESIK